MMTNHTSSQGRSAAFFDLDRTLISGSSVYTFGLVAWRNGMMPTREIISDAARAITFRFGGANDDKADMVRDRVLQGIKGQTTETLSDLGDQIIGTLLEHVRNESQGFLTLHQEAGRDTYIVTASPVEIVARLAEELDMTGAIATVAETVDGVYTGRLAEPFCYGPGKAEGIAKLAVEKGYDLRLCYAYSDSASDLPMLELVGHPVAVNPDRRLEAIARGRGWPIDRRVQPHGQDGRPIVHCRSRCRRPGDRHVFPRPSPRSTRVAGVTRPDPSADREVRLSSVEGERPAQRFDGFGQYPLRRCRYQQHGDDEGIRHEPEGRVLRPHQAEQRGECGRRNEDRHYPARLLEDTDAGSDETGEDDQPQRGSQLEDPVTFVETSQQQRRLSRDVLDRSDSRQRDETDEVSRSVNEDEDGKRNPHRFLSVDPSRVGRWLLLCKGPKTQGTGSIRTIGPTGGLGPSDRDGIAGSTV